MLLFRAPLSSQPLSTAQIDVANPLASGLVFCADVGPFGISEGIKRLQPSTFLGSIGYAGQYRGAYLSSGSVNWRWGDDVVASSSPVNGVVSGATQTTVDVLFRSRNIGASYHLFSQWNISSGNHWLVQVNGSGLIWVAAQDGSGNRRRWDGSSLFTQAKWHRLILSWRGGSSMAAWLDGVDITSSLSSVDAVATSIATNPTAMLIASAAGGTPDVDLSFARLWNRGLSNAEGRQLATGRPWQILQPLPRRIWQPQPSAGTVPTITAVYADSVTTSSVVPRVTLDFA